MRNFSQTIILKHFIALILCLPCSSCNRSGDAISSEETLNEIGKTVEENRVDEEESLNDISCEEFLVMYNNWVNKYVSIVEEYMNNPENAELLSNFDEHVVKGEKWISVWGRKSDCIEDTTLNKRYQQLSKDLENKLIDLGL